MGDKGVPIEWYTRLATMALEAIEAGPNAAILMNLEGIKEHLRAAKDGKWPMWAGAPAALSMDDPKRPSMSMHASADDYNAAMDAWIAAARL